MDIKESHISKALFLKSMLDFQGLPVQFLVLDNSASTHDHCHISFRKFKASSWLVTLPETNIKSPLKIGLLAPKGNGQSYSSNPFLGALAVSFREGNCWFEAFSGLDSERIPENERD